MSWRSVSSCAALAAMTVFGGAACSAQVVVSGMSGAINAPGNRSMRRAMIALASTDLCKELLATSLPLKLNPEDPAMGRFFPRQCASKTLENENLFVQISGRGYAWSNLTQRVGFDATIGLAVDQDFQLDGSTMYLYLRPADLREHKFTPLMVEGTSLPRSPLTAILPSGSPADFMQQTGEGLLTSIVSGGFTVIRDPDGALQFVPTLVEPGPRPLQPFERSGSGRTLVMNERIEIHQNEREFIAPIQVPPSGAIYVTARVEGTDAVDLQVYPRAACDPWLDQYTTNAALTPPPSAAVHDEVLSRSAAPAAGAAPPPAGKSAIIRRRVRVPPGQYCVVLDNSSSLGAAMPPNYPGDDRAALVGLALEIGDG